MLDTFYGRMGTDLQVTKKYLFIPSSGIQMQSHIVLALCPEETFALGRAIAGDFSESLDSRTACMTGSGKKGCTKVGS